MAINAFLIALRRCTGGRHHFAFADDVAAVLESLESLEDVLKLFSHFAEISGLSVKPQKCNVVPLGKDWSEDLASEMRGLMATWNVPGIAPTKFAIVDCCRYLGFWVGPGASLATNWCAPLAKFRERVQAIASAGLAASTGTVLFNVKAATTLGYVAQLCPPTAEVIRDGKKGTPENSPCDAEWDSERSSISIVGGGRYQSSLNLCGCPCGTNEGNADET